MVVVWRPHYQVSKEVININMEKRSKSQRTFHMKISIPHRICPGIPQESDIRTIKGILRKLCEEKKVEIIEAEACADPIHMLVSIPPHLSAAQFMGYLKGKSTLIIFDRHSNLRYKYGSRHFWCCGYYADTVGKNKKAIEEYIRNQLAVIHSDFQVIRSVKFQAKKTEA